MALANKSLLLLTNVNQSTTTKQSTQAWAGVQNAQTHVLSQKLDVKDLVTVKDITMAKHFGEGSGHIRPNQDALTGEWLEECELDFLLFLIIFGYADIWLVYCVNWL